MLIRAWYLDCETLGGKDDNTFSGFGLFDQVQDEVKCVLSVGKIRSPQVDKTSQCIVEDGLQGTTELRTFSKGNPHLVFE